MKYRTTRTSRRRFSVATTLSGVLLVIIAVAMPADATAPTTAIATAGFGSDTRPHVAAANVASPATGTCTSFASLTSCALGILAPAGGTHGVYLQRVGSPSLASANASFPFEPASSIKPLIALYAFQQIAHGHAHLTDRIPKIDTSGGSGDCPPSSFTGNEALGNAIQQMLQVSDNNRTRELMEHFGVAKLNAFAASLGLIHTHFRTSTLPPGFNPIGCAAYGFNPLPTTLDGNTMSLNDAGKLWSAIAALPPVYANTFFQLAAGRAMENSVGYDYTGVWPNLATIAQQVAPAGPQRAALTTSFVNHMSVSVKGGSYYDFACVKGPKCEANWFIFTGIAQIPGCTRTTVTHTNYVWGYFINDAVGPYFADQNSSPTGTAFFNASGQLLGPPIAQRLATWAACAPTTPAALHVTTRTLQGGPGVAIETTLATVTDSDQADIAADIVGKISWGDGYTSFATLSGANGTFTVHGWHTYAHPGVHHVSISAQSIASGNRSAAPATITTR